MATPYLPPAPLADEDWWADDDALQRIVRKRAPAAAPRLAALGRIAPQRIDPLAREADRHPPQLREGKLSFHPSYAKLQQLAREHRAFTDAWHGGTRVTSFALGYLYAQAESGYFCPACMTDGAAFVLSRHLPKAPQIAKLVQDDAQGASEGAMFLTERAGGSDVGATETVAQRSAEGAWTLTGDKWFCSNAGADVILTLARMGDAPGTAGLGLFLVTQGPGLRIVRLKDKLGVRSMATGEVELRDAPATLVAPAPHGFKAMAEMVNLSRLYNAVASVAIARRALREGQKNATWRRAFGKPLAEQPLYQKALAGLANDVRGALLFVLDAAAQFDDEREDLLRVLTPLAKECTARLSVDAASLACELLGGNGYIEEWVTPRLLRDAQVLPIWEGTSHVQSLDFLRAAKHLGAFCADTAKLAPALAPELDALAHEIAARPSAQMPAQRWLKRAYHLRCAALLEADAADGDAGARVHADAYRLRHVEEDEAAFEALVESQAAALVRC